jgi:hypothetical protein
VTVDNLQLVPLSCVHQKIGILRCDRKNNDNLLLRIKRKIEQGWGITVNFRILSAAMLPLPATAFCSPAAVVLRCSECHTAPVRLCCVASVVSALCQPLRRHKFHAGITCLRAVALPGRTSNNSFGCSAGFFLPLSSHIILFILPAEHYSFYQPNTTQILAPLLRCSIPL